MPGESTPDPPGVGKSEPSPLENPEWKKAREALAKISPKNTSNGMVPGSNSMVPSSPTVPSSMVPSYGQYPYFQGYYNQYPPPYNYSGYPSYPSPVNPARMVRTEYCYQGKITFNLDSQIRVLYYKICYAQIIAQNEIRVSSMLNCITPRYNLLYNVV